MWTTRERALFKRKAPQTFPWRNWRSPQCDPVGNKQVKGKTFAKRTTGHTEHINYSKRRDGFLKYVKGNEQKEKEAEEKGTWVQLKGQAAPPGEARL